VSLLLERVALRSAPDNVSPRNIQQRLHEILPPDYSKDHRRFRPSNDIHMKLRFDHLRRCKKGRISKERWCRSPTVLRPRTPIQQAISKPLSDLFEGYAKAFRNYTTSSETTPITSTDLLDSQTVNPSLLLLDGSSLPSNQDVGSTDTTSAPVGRLLDHQDQRSRINLDGGLARQQSPRLSSHPKEAKSRIGRLRGFEKELANKYSESDLKHISSVLRFSSSNSWRSSLSSLSSHASSLLSKFFNRDTSIIEFDSSISRKDLSPTTQKVAASREAGPNALFRSRAYDVLAEEDENWLQWLEESMIQPVAKIPYYYGISPLNRWCCVSMLNPLKNTLCEKCGFFPEHRRAVSTRRISYAYPSRVNMLDFYGNTPLHCAAASVERGKFGQIKSIVLQGVDVTICNTFGETFLHVLCGKGPTTTTDMIEFVEMLGHLSRVNFPFSKPDHHGRTILHKLIQHSPNTHGISFLSQTFSFMKPNISWQDNAGFRVDRFLEDPNHKAPGATHEELLVALVAPFRGSCSNFPFFEPSQNNRVLASSWLRLKRRPWCVTSIDVAGDTPLTSLLKYWTLHWPLEDGLEISSYSGLRDIVEDMITLGVEIHMRDRSGDTALAIAARGGHRAVIALLLEKGANVHSRNYRGVGILRQLNLLMSAGTQNITFWASLWSSHLVLIDAGAKYSPTDHDEWMLPISRRLDAQRRTVAQPSTFPRPPSSGVISHPSITNSTVDWPQLQSQRAAFPQNDNNQTQASAYSRDSIKPTPSRRARTPAMDTPSANGSVEIFKSFRVSMGDPCYKVLPAALKRYNITAPWEQYSLYIVYGDQERCLGMEEKPLILFEQLDKAGKRPMFMLRWLPNTTADTQHSPSMPASLSAS
jgi:ankyrin repeat protein